MPAFLAQLLFALWGQLCPYKLFLFISKTQFYVVLIHSANFKGFALLSLRPKCFLCFLDGCSFHLFLSFSSFFFS